MKAKKKNITLYVVVIALIMAILCGVAALALGAASKDNWIEVAGKIRQAQGLHKTPIAKTASLSATGVTMLDLDIEGGKYQLKHHDGDDILIEYFEDYENEVIASIVDGTLIFDRDDFGAMINYDCTRNEFVFGTGLEWWLFGDYRAVTINLPRAVGFIRSEIDISGGKLVATDVELGRLDIDISGGDAQLDCGVAAIEEIGISGGRLTLKSDNLATVDEIDISGGAVEIKSSSLASINGIDVSGGVVEIKSSSLASIKEIDISGGVVRIDNAAIRGEVIIEVSGGSVIFNKLNIDPDLVGFSVATSGGGVYFNSKRLKRGHHSTTGALCMFRADISGGKLEVRTVEID